MEFSVFDQRMMRRALALAERGRYSTSPNPMVGAVVARNGRVIAEGFHSRAGGPHAEIEALRRAASRARGATLYVTLEPCSHTGRTAPCADALIRAEIAAAIVARRDPNPAISGKGLTRLRRAGIRVVSGLLEAESAQQNERFDLWVTRGRPFVLAKVAATLDGKIADSRGRSKWISNAVCRRRAMKWREEYDAILVGAGTVSADDPRLTRRLGLNRTTPQRRIVLDGMFRVREDARVFRNGSGVEVWTATRAGRAKEVRLARRGVTVVRWPFRREGRVDLDRALARLGREGVTGLIVEGGSRTLGAFAQARLVDRWAFFLAPAILGGTRSVSAVSGPDISLLDATRLSDLEVEILDGDLLVTGRTEA